MIRSFCLLLLFTLTLPIGAAENATAPTGQAGQENDAAAVKKLATDLRGNPKKLLEMKPTAAEIGKITATKEDAAMLETYVEKMFASLPPNGMEGRPEQSEVLVRGPDELPGGYKEAVSHLAKGLRIYGFKYVKPGESSGMAFDGLVKVDGRWVIIPKMWRAFQKDKRSGKMSGGAESFLVSVADDKSGKSHSRPPVDVHPGTQRDGSGRIVGSNSVSPDGKTITRRDASGRIIGTASATKGASGTSTTHRDGSGRIIGRTDTNSSTGTATTRDASGRIAMTASTTEGGSSSTTTYRDGSGRILGTKTVNKSTGSVTYRNASGSICGPDLK
ncbi:MAG: hypothetical protein KA004_13275 [Verrucomicrobiales bacterium]|nr:hypothetical protein [Verrucomicrobiales bacterium]